MILFYFCLICFGLIFGSFSSVLIFRLFSGETGIVCGRSKCAKCSHKLSPDDLIPVLSYLLNLGKCRYCKAKISAIYPLLEITMASVFFLVGYYLVDCSLILSLDYVEILKLIFFLFLGFLSVVIAFYDILFLEIHEKLLLTGIIISAIFIFIQAIFGIKIFPTYEVFDLGKGELIFSIGFFIAIIGLLYIIILKGLKEIYDLLIIFLIILSLFFTNIFLNINFTENIIFSSIVGIIIIFTFFYLQIFVSNGKWLGGGDLRIAILFGMILGLSYTLYGLFITYLVGSIIGILAIIIQKCLKKAKVDTTIPFGPFLVIGLFLTLIFQNEISRLANYYL